MHRQARQQEWSPATDQDLMALCRATAAPADELAVLHALGEPLDGVDQDVDVDASMASPSFCMVDAACW